MKLLFVSNLFPDTGEPYRGLDNATVLHHLHARGHEIRVLAPRPVLRRRAFAPRELDLPLRPEFLPVPYVPKLGGLFNHRLMAADLRPALARLRRDIDEAAPGALLIVEDANEAERCDAQVWRDDTVLAAFDGAIDILQREGADRLERTPDGGVALRPPGPWAADLGPGPFGLVVRALPDRRPLLVAGTLRPDVDAAIADDDGDGDVFLTAIDRSSGARLVRMMRPDTPSTGPAGLSKSRSSRVTRPPLVPVPGAQSRRPSNRARPDTGDRTRSAPRGVRSDGWRPPSAKTRSAETTSTPPTPVRPSWANVSRTTGAPWSSRSKTPLQVSPVSRA
jgi:hypothetical protein